MYIFPYVSRIIQINDIPIMDQSGLYYANYSEI